MNEGWGRKGIGNKDKGWMGGWKRGREGKKREI